MMDVSVDASQVTTSPIKFWVYTEINGYPSISKYSNNAAEINVVCGAEIVNVNT